MQDMRSSFRSAFRRSGKKERKRGRPRQLKIRLKFRERKRLEEFMKRGQKSVQEVKRAQALRLLDKGWSPEDVGEAVGMTGMGVRKIAERYEKNGVGGAVEEPSRPGREREITQAGRETIRIFMEENSLKPWREKNVVRCGVDPGIREEDGGRS